LRGDEADIKRQLQPAAGEDEAGQRAHAAGFGRSWGGHGTSFKGLLGL
jgi:hypothetical protein